MNETEMFVSKKFNVVDTSQEKLTYLLKQVRTAHDYFKDNAKRFKEFTNFVCNTAITAQDKQKLDDLQKPPIEFNILEALVSRLRGEWSKHEPGIKVSAADCIQADQLTDELIQTIKVVECYIRQTLFDGTNDFLQYNLMTDLLIGGYSVAYVFTEYVNNMSFDQNIRCERVFDPCMTFFDPLARDSHKGDGNYCGQIFPKTKEEFIREFGEEAARDFTFEREIEGFSWSYRNDETDIILVCDYFEKIKRRKKIVKLTNGKVVPLKRYKEALAQWEEKGFIEQPPLIVGKPRMTEVETIVRYRFCQNKILDYIVTDYTYLPLVFFDGNSVIINDRENSNNKQMTRPFVYHAKGIQKLKNFSGQTVAAEIENMVQHKFKASVESIPEKYQSVYQNIQAASVLLYNEFYDGNPDVRLSPPMEIQRTPTPPLVQSTFLGSDEVTRAILGSYDSQLGINGADVSGVAIQQGAMQSNAAALPYTMGYIKGLTRVGQIIVDLIPKYYVTPRSLPVMESNGKRGYQLINIPERHQQGEQEQQEQDPENPVFNKQSISMRYDPNILQVKIEVGVNTAVQKQIAIDQIIRMMQSSELFAQFINEDGLETLLDNMDIRGIDQLKMQAAKFMAQLKQRKAQAEQNAEKNNPLAMQAKIEEGKIQQKTQESQGRLMVQTAQVAVAKQKADTEQMVAMATLGLEADKHLLQQERVDAENARTATEMAISVSGHHLDIDKHHRENLHEVKKE